MPKPSSRLDLFVVPDEVDAAPDVAALDAIGLAHGWWTAQGGHGPQATDLVEGGFVRRLLHADPQPRLYANQQGGFSVRCPGCDALVVRAFSAAVETWRAGGERQMTCPTCGAAFALEEASFRPDAAFARVALHLGDVGSYGLQPGAASAIASVWGPIRWIGRRTW